MKRLVAGMVLASAIVLGSLMLSFHGSSTAAPPQQRLPFASAIDQRIEMINQLRQIRLLLQEQNTLLRKQNALLESGKLHVVVGKAGD